MAFEEDSFGVGIVEDLLAFDGTEGEGIAAEVVDLMGHSRGVVVDAGDETVADELVSMASDVEMMLYIACGFFLVKGFEVKAEGEALAEAS